MVVVGSCFCHGDSVCFLLDTQSPWASAYPVPACSVLRVSGLSDVVKAWLKRWGCFLSAGGSGRPGRWVFRTRGGLCDVWAIPREAFSGRD